MKKFQNIMMLSLLLMLAGSSTASADDEIIFTTNIDGVDITFTGYETDKTCYVGRNVYYDAYGSLSYENHILAVAIDTDKPINIPWSANDYSVVGINPGAFMGCKKIPSVSISHNCISFGEKAFYGCESLTDACIESYSIGAQAFANCVSLSNVTLGFLTSRISSKAFYGCRNLKHIELPNGIEEIGSSAFYGCGLTSITIPENIKEIGDCAFWGCEDLRTVKSNLKEPIDFRYGSLPFSDTTYEEGILIVPNGTKEKYETTRGWKEFKNIVEEYIVAPTEEGIEMTFKVTSKEDCMVMGQEGNPAIASNTEGTVTIPTFVDTLRVTSIGERAFRDCEQLTNVIIPDGITSIGEMAFNLCIQLSNIKLPESLESIGFAAFAECFNLTKITIPANVTSIGGFALNNKLVEVTSCIQEPFPLDEGVFSKNTYDEGILYVPLGTKEKYATTEGWSKFKKIVEIDLMTGVATAENRQCNTAATVYTLSGQRLAAPRKGLNIIDGKKVVVK